LMVLIAHRREVLQAGRLQVFRESTRGANAGTGSRLA
jgi:hypothetical protein